MTYTLTIARLRAEAAMHRADAAVMALRAEGQIPGVLRDAGMAAAQERVRLARAIDAQADGLEGETG